MRKTIETSGANHKYNYILNFPILSILLLFFFTMALLFIANDSCVPCGMVLFVCKKGRKWLMRALRDGFVLFVKGPQEMTYFIVVSNFLLCYHSSAYLKF